MSIRTIGIPFLLLVLISSCRSTSSIEGKWVTTYLMSGEDLASFELKDERLTVTTADGVTRNSTILNRAKGEFQFTEEDGGIARCFFLTRDERNLSIIVRRSNSVDTLNFIDYSLFDKPGIDAESFRRLLVGTLWTDSSYSHQFLNEGILIKNKIPADGSQFIPAGYDFYTFDSLLFIKMYEVGAYLFNVRINNEQSIDLWEMRHNLVFPLRKAQIDKSFIETQSKMMDGTWQVAGQPILSPSYGTIQLRYDPRLPTFETMGWGTGIWALDYTGRLMILKNNTRPIPVIIQINEHLGDRAVLCEGDIVSTIVGYLGTNIQ